MIILINSGYWFLFQRFTDNNYPANSFMGICSKFMRTLRNHGNQHYTEWFETFPWKRHRFQECLTRHLLDSLNSEVGFERNKLVCPCQLGLRLPAICFLLFIRWPRLPDKSAVTSNPFIRLADKPLSSVCHPFVWFLIVTTKMKAFYANRLRFKPPPNCLSVNLPSSYADISLIREVIQLSIV
jgi:hypothetical protein